MQMTEIPLLSSSPNGDNVVRVIFPAHQLLRQFHSDVAMMDTQDYDIHETVSAFVTFYQMRRTNAELIWLKDFTARQAVFDKEADCVIGEHDGEFLMDASANLFEGIERLMQRADLLDFEPVRVYLLTPFGEDYMMDTSTGLVLEVRRFTP